jgi:hypothetical protein
MKSKSIYRPLFLEAWQTVWQHKRLWLVGIFATAMASGGLFESLSGNWQTALTGRKLLEQLINGTLPGYTWLVTYSSLLARLEPFHQYLLATLILLIVAAIIIIGAVAQGALFAGALEKKPSTFRELIKMGRHFFGRVLWLDILGKIGLGVVFLITVVPVAFLNPLPYSWHKYPPFISLILFLTGAIFITVLQMLAMTGVVRKHLNVHGAIVEAWNIFRFHILVTFELGILLFATSLLAILATLILLIVLAIPITILFIIASLIGSTVVYGLSIIISITLVIAVILLVSGFLNAFQYTVWSLFFEEAGRFGIVPLIKKIIRR